MRRYLLVVLIVLAFGCREKSPAAHLRVLEKTVTLPFGRCMPITLQWDMLRPLDNQTGKPVVFLHLLLPPRDVVRTFDHPFPAEWRPGSKHTYQYDLCQSADAPRINPGPYTISGGLYDGGNGQRWPLLTDGREVGTFDYAIVDAEATDDGQASRSIRLDGGWGPLVSAGDRQIVARRLLDKDASASIHMASKVGNTLRLSLGVRGGQATVVNSCSPADTRTVPDGFHVLELPACAGGEVRIDRNASKVSLEGVAWK